MTIHNPILRKAPKHRDIGEILPTTIYNFDWKRIGQFDINKVRLLNKNHGLLVKSMELVKMLPNGYLNTLLMNK